MPIFPEVFLREREVKAVAPYSRSGRYALIKQDKFPASIKIGERASAWRQSEIAAWQRWRIAIAEGRADQTSSWRDFLEGSPEPQARQPESLPLHGSGVGTIRRRGRS